VALSGAASRETRTVCPYCGVGCGVLATVRQGRVLGVRGDPAHPTNRGGLCGKGQRLAETLRPGDRLLHPMLRTRRTEPLQRRSWEATLAHCAERIRDVQARHGKDSMAFYLSGQLLTEDYYVANKLVKGFLGTNNVDTNSRLCMASAAVAYKLALGSDAPPGCYADADEADAVLFTGSNAAQTHPIVFGRLLEARRRTGAAWVVVDPRRTPTSDAADIHLQIRPGSDVALLLAMLHVCIEERLVDQRFVRTCTSGFDAAAAVAREWPPHRAADTCDVDGADIRRAARTLWGADRVLSLWCQGLNQASTATDRNLALLNLHLATGQIGRPGAGPFSLTGQANAMGGREVGGLATELAAHRRLDSAADREEVAAFWGSGPIAAEPGLTAVELVDALLDGRVRALWVAGTNPVASLPDAQRVEAALRAAELVVVQDLYPTETTRFADVLLPAAGWGEKTGTLTSSERRVALAQRLVDPPGEARPDWAIFSALAGHLGHGAAFAYRDAADVYEEHAALSADRTCDVSSLSHERLQRDGSVQWPCPPERAEGTERRYTDGVFATPDGRARFHPTPWREPAEQPDEEFPLRLTTTRSPAAWHTRTKTGRVAELRRSESARVSVSASDAAQACVAHGDVVELVSRRGRWRGRVEVDGAVAPGTVALPFHGAPLWSRGGWANALTVAALDPRSRQPELKHAAVRLVPARPLLDGVTVVAGDHHDPLAPALAAALTAAGVRDVRCTAGGAKTRRDATADHPLLLVTAAPLVVDAGGRVVDRDHIWAVGPQVRIALGLRLTADPQRMAAALLAEGHCGWRALTRADWSRAASGARCFTGGDPEPEPDDDAQDVHVLNVSDPARGVRVRWRLGSGQVLGVLAEGPDGVVRRVAAAWHDDLSPAEVRTLAL